MSPDIFALIPFIIPPTALSRAIAEEVVKLASLQKYKVKALRGFSATRLPVFLEAQAHPEVAILIYFGHASQSKLCGESILCDTITVEDASWLKDKVVCSLPACESAHTLGPELVRRGVRAYFGSEDTMYAHFTEIEHNYFADWVDYTTTFYKALFAGRTFGDCVEAYKYKATQYIELYKSKVVEWPNADWYVQAATKNRDGFKLIGNPSDKLEPPVKTETPTLALGDLRDVLLGFSATAALMIATTVAPIAYKELRERKII